MKKTGFTLAEVLITLAIVGIIAAVTIPALSRNVSQKSIGPTLAKGVNNLNAANSEALSKSGKTTLDKVANDSYLKMLELYLNGNLDQENKVFYTHDGIAYIVNTDSTKKTKGIFDENKDYQGSECGRYESANIDDIPDECFDWVLADKYGKRYWEVLVDINGKKDPNQGGQDRFKVYVDTNGIVIPAGSLEADNYIGAAKREKDCLNLTENQVIDEFCTATIIQNGWEMKF